MPKLTPEGVQRLQRVRGQVLAEPKNMNMDYWWRPAIPVESCGTVGCIAGWLYQNNRKREDPTEPGVSWSESGANLIFSESGEAYGAYHTALSLFFVSIWPDEFRERLGRQDPGTREYAQVVADRIDAFIEQYQ